jgi:tol-pal system protein YbgF
MRFFVFAALVALGSVPLYAANRDMVQLQTQVQALQDQMTAMQRSFDESMGVMKNLITQSTDNINRMSAAVDALQKSVQQQNSETSNHVDQVGGQVQALHDSLDELKARVAQVSKQLSDMQAAQQNLNPSGAPGAPGGTAQPAQQQPPQAQAPPADVLYNNALRDYNAAKYQLATQEFSDYLKYYGTTDLAGNAQFYIAEIDYRQGKYDDAVKAYDAVLEQYPGGNKTPAAELKKGFALLNLGQRDAAIRELKALINRYPRSIEATQARDRLRRLTSEPAPSASKRVRTPQS